VFASNRVKGEGKENENHRSNRGQDLYGTGFKRTANVFKAYGKGEESSPRG